MNMDNVLYMEQGKNYSFGSEPKKIIDLSQNEIKVSNLRDADFNNFIHHDKNAGNPAIESLLAAMSEIPDLPTPLGSVEFR